MPQATTRRAACFITPNPADGEAAPTPVRVCVIDLGTNSFHAVIVDAHPNGTFEQVDKMKIMVRLGQTGLASHRLPKDAMQRGYEALERIMLLAKGWKTREYLAFATSAIREAKNGGAFIERVRTNLGLRIRPISGSQEADLIYKGVRQVVDMPRPALIVDIGGGSTEFIVGTDREVGFAVSLKVGAARMTERFVTTDPIEASEEEAMRAYFREVLRPVLKEARAAGVQALVGSSGTMESLAQVCAVKHGDAGRSVFQQEFLPKAMRKVTAFIIGSKRQQRDAIEGIDPRRVEQIVAGAILVDVLLEEMEFDVLRVSPYALREGMVRYFMEQNYKRIRQIAPFADVRRRSVNQLGYQFRWEETHARHVAASAVLLFDATRPLHGLDAADRELLEYAALLHDLGYHISHRAHHRHSLYLIQNADLHGFRPREIDVMALVARFHRGSLPSKKKHAPYRALPRKDRTRAEKMAALLRLAEGLDRSHFQNVTGVRTELRNDIFHLALDTKGDPQLEIWATEQGGDLFEQVFGCRVEVEAGTVMEPEAERQAAAESA